MCSEFKYPKILICFKAPLGLPRFPLEERDWRVVAVEKP